MSRKRSPRHRLIDVLASRWVDLRYGLCAGNYAMMKGIHRGSIAKHARNWLAQHGSLPTCTHKVKVHEKRTGGMRWSAGPTLVVDFDRLQSDPAYPEGVSAEWNPSIASRPASWSPTTAAPNASSTCRLPLCGAAPSRWEMSRRHQNDSPAVELGFARAYVYDSDGVS